jgi:hypothetical protein
LAPETAPSETFCFRLREILAPASPMEIEVVNAGCPQYGPLLSLLLLKHSLLGLAPALVICNFDMSDIADDHRCRRSVRMKGSQPLYCPHPELERQRTAAERLWVERLLMWQHAKHGLAYLIGSEDRPEDSRDIDAPQGTYAWLRDDPPDWSVYIDQTLDVISQISEVCRRSNCQFVLSAVPSPWQISAEASSGPGVRTRVGIEEHSLFKSRLPYETLSAFSRKQGILFCDPSTVFVRVKQPERLYRRNAARFSATGHELYARILARFVEQNLPGRWGSGRSPRSGVGNPISAVGAPPNSTELHSRAIHQSGFNQDGQARPSDSSDRMQSARQAHDGLSEAQSAEFHQQSGDEQSEFERATVRQKDTERGGTR